MMGQFVCRGCGAAFSLDEPRWRCDCGSLLDLEWRPGFDLEAIARRPPTMWRYREALPLGDGAHIVSMDEGFTPLLEVDFSGVPVWIKQDQLFPTGSYKDRGASVLISKVVEWGIGRVVEDSSGNAGCAIAAYCARAGIGCEVYVPASASADKVIQIERYGAGLHRVAGTREDTAQAALGAAQATYYASHSWNPLFFHGTKTFAFEVSEQLGWRAPDTVILPVGNGTLLLGAALGFRELYDAGVTDRVPKLIAIQSEACAPLYWAWRESPSYGRSPSSGAPLAEGIAIADPVRGMQIVEAVRDSGGAFLVVSDAEIADSLREMCHRGFYIEPTAAAATAGVAKYVQNATPGETIVSVFTGHGLKATVKMQHV